MRRLRDMLAQLANPLREEGPSMSSSASATRRLPRPMAEWVTSGTPAGEGVRILAIVGCHGLPLSVSAYAAHHHEVTSVPLSFNCYKVEAKPEHLVGDRTPPGYAETQNARWPPLAALPAPLGASTAFQILPHDVQIRFMGPQLSWAPC